MSTLNPTDGQPAELRFRKSRFQAQDLHNLNDTAKLYLLPLSVIAHIDLNAFFAQCEQIRLNKLIDDPVVCAQWQLLIAVLYAARKYGISRMDSIKAAREKCPNLIVGHAAVFIKGDSHWLYLDSEADQLAQKVLLDPYRRELRKIMKLLARLCDLVEKASVDECFLDLGRLVYARILEAFPEVEGCTELPVLSNVPFRWQGHIEGELVEDWDDVCFLIGSQLLFEFRMAIYKELKYTTSGGLGLTKSTAKLGGGLRKPDAQTIVLPKHTLEFLKKFELADFTSMGAKTGEQILQRLGVPPSTNSIVFIRENFTLEELQKQDAGEKVYELVRGAHRQKVTPRTDIKLMMSRKNIINRNVKTLADANDWLKVFSGDLYGRLVELDDENMQLLLLQQDQGKRFLYRPRTISVHVNIPGTHLKQTLFPFIANLENLRLALQHTGLRLLGELIETVSASDLNPGISLKDVKMTDDLKRVKMPFLVGIGMVLTNFVKTTEANFIDKYADLKQGYVHKMFEDFQKEASVSPVKTVPKQMKPADKEYVKRLFTDFEQDNKRDKRPKSEPTKEEDPLLRELIATGRCSQCNKKVDDVFEHKDFHVAMDLQDRLNGVRRNDIKSRKAKEQGKLPW